MNIHRVYVEDIQTDNIKTDGYPYRYVLDALRVGFGLN